MKGPTKAGTGISFALLLPALVLVVCSSWILLPALEAYLRLKAQFHGQPSALLSNGSFQLELPREHLFLFCLRIASVGREQFVAAINIPGFILQAILSRLFGFSPGSFPALTDMFTWRTVTSQLCTLPAWYFAGRGVDGLTKKRRVGRVGLITSIVLSPLCLALALGFRFGLTAAERDASTYAAITGLAIWALLFAIPAAAWVRQTAPIANQQPS